MATYTSLSSDQVGAWLAQLQPASWRGLGFAVDSSSVRRGRRVAVHEYPFRDDIWVEDIGRNVRAVAFSGFVVGDDCYVQAQALLAASETAGSGELIHPSLGSLTVALVSPMESIERKEMGRVVEIRFEFLETGLPTYPDSSISTTDQSDVFADGTDDAAQSDFLTGMTGATGPLAEGAAVVLAGVATVSAWVGQVARLAGDASLVTGAVAGLIGNFSRFASGARGALLVGATTAEQVLFALSAARVSIASACAGAEISAGTLSSDPVASATFMPSVQAVPEALRGACNDPADAVRLLSILASYAPLTTVSVAPIGQSIYALAMAMGQGFRRAALTSLARACATYQPSSYDDALNLRIAVAPLYDAEITIAADAGQDTTYQALRTLRAGVLNDLIVRGSDLSRLTTITTKSPQTSLALAYRLYRDASRSDDLIARAKPVHPAFMPTSFQALSS